MSENRNHFSLYGKSPLSQFFISVGIIVIAGLFPFTVMLLAGTLIFGIDHTAMSGNFLAENVEKNIGYLRYLVIVQDICLFILPAIIILVLLKPVQQKGLMDLKRPRIIEVFLVILLAFCIFPVTSFTGQLNAGMHLPDWLSDVERWMTEKEADANNLIDSLIVSKTFWVMILNLLMIALLPAIGEELIFRGVFQKIFYSLFKSGHLAIWFTAFVFSALHFQFFGFIPRIILGLVFGYLFFWSGTLWLPMIAHFINNAVPVIGELIHVGEKVSSQPDVTLWKQIIGLPVPILISVLILLYFRKKSKKNSEAEIKQSLPSIT